MYSVADHEKKLTALKHFFFIGVDMFFIEQSLQVSSFLYVP